MTRLRVDTDIGGDVDDACALAMLLGMADVDLVAITTVMDARGVRAARACHLRGLVGRADDPRHWPVDLEPVRGAPGAALDALGTAVDAETTIVSIGGFTNLAMLEVAAPGTLARARVVACAGWFRPWGDADGPAWDLGMDWNVQVDPLAAEMVAAAVGSLTLVPMPTTLGAHARTTDAWAAGNG